MTSSSSVSANADPSRPVRPTLVQVPGPDNAIQHGWHRYGDDLLTSCIADGPGTSDLDGSDIAEVEAIYRSAFVDTVCAAALGCTDFDALFDLFMEARMIRKYSDVVRIKQRSGPMIRLRRRRHGLLLAAPRARAQAAAIMAYFAEKYAEAGSGNEQFRTTVLAEWIVRLKRWSVSSRASAVCPPDPLWPPSDLEQRSAEPTTSPREQER
jgi:hypothetical protein